MTNKEAQAASVAAVAEIARKRDPQFAEAFIRPALKTAPVFFSSIEDAEAAGWTFNADLGRWDAPAEELAAMREKEKIAKALRSDDKVNALSVMELRAAIEMLSAEAAPATEVPELRRLAKELAASFEAKARAIRKHNLSEASGRGTGTASTMMGNVCRACGKQESGRRLLQCSRCLGVWYCDASCQRQHWPEHKALCKRYAKTNDSITQSGANVNKYNDVMAWYGSVPNAAEAIACLAWTHRKESPFIRVQGGVNARLVQTECTPRRDWEKVLKSGLDLDLPKRYAQADFDRDVHYFVAISAGHPGTEDWPVATPRMRFPLPADQMDAFVAASEARRARQATVKADSDARNNPWVELTGLTGRSELNGQKGIRGAWDAAKERYAVQLTDGSTIQVRPRNLVFFGRDAHVAAGTRAGDGHGSPGGYEPGSDECDENGRRSAWYRQDATSLVEQALGYGFQREHNNVPSAAKEIEFIRNRFRLSEASGQARPALAKLDAALASFRLVVRQARGGSSSPTAPLALRSADCKPMVDAIRTTLLVFFVAPAPITSDSTEVARWAPHILAWVQTVGLPP